MHVLHKGFGIKCKLGTCTMRVLLVQKNDINGFKIQMQVALHKGLGKKFKLRMHVDEGIACATK
jgi:hypothetical protein